MKDNSYMRKSDIFIIGIIIVSFAIGLYFYPQMPEKLASHWNTRGHVNGYMPKFWALFLMPFLSIGLFLLFIFIPKIDPLKNNIKKFRKHYDWFVVSVILFLFYIYLLTIFWNIGIKFNMTQFLMPGLAALFYCCGVLLKNVKRNWFIGIRTPWTLSNEKVWDKTHKIGGKLFKISGIIALIGIILPDYAPFFILVPVFFSVTYVFAYSYFEYRKVKK